MSFLKNIFKKQDEPLKSYKDFWDWFVKHEKTFFDAVKKQLEIEKAFFDKLRPKLEELGSGFYFLTGMLDDNTAELIFTADGDLKNIIYIEDLVNTAPEVNNWKFTAHKPPPVNNDFGIHYRDYKFDDENVFFYSNDHLDHPDEIDITILYDGINDENKHLITQGIYLFIDNYIGELNSIENIDNLSIIDKSDSQKELVPISKLMDFIIWRQKEFIEKYEGTWYNSENDTYSSFKAETKDGLPVLAIINTSLIEWEAKASHPWILSIDIKFNGDENNGMPDNDTYNTLDGMEEELLTDLKDSGGYLNIGRQTAESVRNIYFGCKDYRKPSKVAYNFQQKYSDKFSIDFEIYKDKYWQTFNRYRF